MHRIFESNFNSRKIKWKSREEGKAKPGSVCDGVTEK